MLRKLHRFVIPGTLAAVCFAVVAAAAGVLYAARDHVHTTKPHVATIRPTMVEYHKFTSTQWPDDLKVNDAAKSMMNMYWRYRHGAISGAALRQYAARTTARMKRLNVAYDQTAPVGYLAFERKVDGVLSAEILCVHYFASSHGVLNDALGDQLYRILVQFNGVAKHMPKPETTTRIHHVSKA